MGKGAHGGGFAGAGHSHNPDYPEDTWNLYQHIEFCDALNVTESSDAGGVFKPHVHRLDPEPRLVSDADAEMMIRVTFASPVHIRRIMVIGGGDQASHPAKLKAFVNRPDLDFASADGVAVTEEWDLAANVSGEGFVTTKPARFSNITSVTFLISENLGDEEQTMLQYIGLQGDHTHDRREAVDAKYELMCTHMGSKVVEEQGSMYKPE